MPKFGKYQSTVEETERKKREKGKKGKRERIETNLYKKQERWIKRRRKKSKLKLREGGRERHIDREKKE